MAFGTKKISFKGCSESVEQVFGKEPIPTSQLMKKIWDFIKAKDLYVK